MKSEAREQVRAGRTAQTSSEKSGGSGGHELDRHDDEREQDEVEQDGMAAQKSINGALPPVGREGKTVRSSLLAGKAA